MPDAKEIIIQQTNEIIRAPSRLTKRALPIAAGAALMWAGKKAAQIIITQRRLPAVLNSLRRALPEKAAEAPPTPPKKGYRIVHRVHEEWTVHEE